MTGKQQKSLTFIAKEDGEQLLTFIMREMHGISKNKVKAYLVNRLVRVDNVIKTHPLLELKKGQKIELDRSRQKHTFHCKDLSIVFEDPYLVVIDKNEGLLSMSLTVKQQTAQTILNQYLEKGKSLNRSHLVHRLDRDTSGLMIYAKDVKTQQSFIHDWQELVTDRRYVALVEGELQQRDGVVSSWLKDDNRFVTHSSPVDNGGKLAITHYRTLLCKNGYSLVELDLETGRKNQIRVHLQDLGHSIVGDYKYGSENSSIGRLALHAYMLCFRHPVTGKMLHFETPVPASFESLLNG